MKSSKFKIIAGLALVGLVAGCASSSETASRDTLTDHVGKYDPAPRGINQPRVGVPAFGVSPGGGETERLAADQMATLLEQSDRFNVIERTQLSKLMDEQNLQGVVKAGELAGKGQVRGVDYLLIGKVTNLRVKTDRKERGFGLAQAGGTWFNVGAADVKKKDVVVTSECGVDIRMVNPTTGETLWSNFSEFKRTDTAEAFGLDILGGSATADADINVSEDDKGKVLRLALDDALRKSMPRIDKFLKSEKNAPASPAAPAPANAAARPAAPAAAAKKFCPTCGTEVAAGAKFCPHDGAKLD